MTVAAVQSAKKRRWPWALAGVGLATIVALGWFLDRVHRPPPPPPVPGADPLRPLVAVKRLTVWWDAVPPRVQAHAVRSGEDSNIRPADYAGPDACQKCHARNYRLWSEHPHRWMNALATPATVHGDFSGQAVLSYLGGRATFTHEGNQYLMRLKRGAERRTYAITQTIGSRFYQYYVGKQLEGPEPPNHPFFQKDHVLPFGYWLAEKEWVPIVHVGPELPDGKRPDPFAPMGGGRHYAEYAVGCNHCHTTFPLSDLLGRRPDTVTEHAPFPLHWSMGKHMQEAHPSLYATLTDQIEHGPGLVRNPMDDWEASRYAVTLGISCEACHLGAKQHVDSAGQVPPRFFPSSPNLWVETGGARPEFGRTHENVNWACGRCHTGKRPQFAAGMSTWNSVEYADAMRGSCYWQLRCIDCHNPHRAIGPRWSASAEQDDAVCFKCHKQFAPAAARQAHTHHRAGSEGSRCLNCHMPRINEGLQDVVRTHMIYSPTRADMIEANHPNACNLCHTDRPIDWTLDYLKQWYHAGYDPAKIAATYPDRTAPAAVGWVHSPDPAVRLVAVEALTRGRDFQALPQILEALDDPYLLNRQFAFKGLRAMLGTQLPESGYRFYMTPEERRQPLATLRGKLTSTAALKHP
jgi:predicted CXXCH cytochrome family protein